jgi:hypothetical protein
MKFTGERYVPEVGGAIHAEHLHRYLLALELANGRDVLDVPVVRGMAATCSPRRRTRW